MVLLEKESKSEPTLLRHYNLKMNYSQDIKQQIFSNSGGSGSF